MFRWTCPHPLVSRLDELLQDAGAEPRHWEERAPGDVLIFQPLHLLLEEGRLPWEGIKAGMRLLLRAAGEVTATIVNGELMLGCTAGRLSQWSIGQVLPTEGSGEPPPALAGSLAIALMQLDGELEGMHQQLEAACCNENVESRISYRNQLLGLKPEHVISQFNHQRENAQAAASAQNLRQQLFELEDECERQYMIGLDIINKLNTSKRLNRQVVEQLNCYAKTASRMLAE